MLRRMCMKTIQSEFAFVCTTESSNLGTCARLEVQHALHPHAELASCNQQTSRTFCGSRPSSTVICPA